MSPADFFTNILVSGGVTSIVLFFGKNLILHSFQTDFFRFSKMHEKRAEVISELYKKVFTVEERFISLMSPLQMAGEDPKEVKVKKAVEAANELIIYFGQHRLYLNENTEEKVDNLLKKFSEIWRDWMQKEDLDKHSPDYRKEWASAWEKINEQIPPLKKLIETDFRNLIGVEKN